MNEIDETNEKTEKNEINTQNTLDDDLTQTKCLTNSENNLIFSNELTNSDINHNNNDTNDVIISHNENEENNCESESDSEELYGQEKAKDELNQNENLDNINYNLNINEKLKSNNYDFFNTNDERKNTINVSSKRRTFTLSNHTNNENQIFSKPKLMKSSTIKIENDSEKLPLEEETLSKTNYCLSINDDPLRGSRLFSLKTKDNILSYDCEFGMDFVSSKLLNDFMKINSPDFLYNRLTPRKYFFRRLSAQEILTWQKSEIRNPLLFMQNDDDKFASIQLFRNLLSYMKERKSSKPPLSHIKKYLRIIHCCSPIVKDEAYLQAYKQINNNKKRESLIRAYKFLAFLASTFVPNSEDIYFFILNFLFFSRNENKNDNEIIKHVNYIFMRMVKTKERERKNVPCLEELEYIECLKSILINVYFFTGKEKQIKVESYTTFKEVKNNIMNLLDFNSQRSVYYSIYEICYKKNGTEERFIDDNEIVCDVISLWRSDIIKHQKKNEKIYFKFYLKLLIYYPFDHTNYDTISIIYYQTLYDVISGKFELEEKEILILAALELTNEFQQNHEKAYNSLLEHYTKYVPGNKLNLLTQCQWIEKIISIYNTISNYQKKDIKLMYLKFLEKFPTYQAQLFDSQYIESRSSDTSSIIPKNCILGFKSDRVIIFDENKNVVTFFLLEKISNWGISRESFVLSVLENDNIKRLHFKTGQTNVIQTLLEVYGHLLVGTSLFEITALIEERDKKFENFTSVKRIPSKYYRDIEKDNEVFPIMPTESNQEDESLNENESFTSFE